MLPSIPTPEQVNAQPERDPDEIDRLLVERLTFTLKSCAGMRRIYVDVNDIARVTPPRTGLDPVRARAKEIAEASHWHVEIDSRSGYLVLSTPEAQRASQAARDMVADMFDPVDEAGEDFPRRRSPDSHDLAAEHERVLAQHAALDGDRNVLPSPEVSDDLPDSSTPE